MGQTTTVLPDGRGVHIAGAHEDYHNPDFFIYNDVIVTDPSKPWASCCTIYGYPKTIFPPMDFHTATYYHDPITNTKHIYVIGGFVEVQHKDDRDNMLVHRLDIEDFSMHRIEVKGDNPGLLTNLHAEMNEDTHKVILKEMKESSLGGNW